MFRKLHLCLRVPCFQHCSQILHFSSLEERLGYFQKAMISEESVFSKLTMFRFVEPHIAQQKAETF